MIDNRFGSNIRLLRKRKKLTLENLAENLGVSKSAISDYEVGKTFPPLDVCEAFSNFFGINIDDLKNQILAELSTEAIEELIISKAVAGKNISNDFSKEKNQLEFHNKLLGQQLEGLQIQLLLIKQIIASKDAEIKSLQIQVRLLDEKFKDFAS